MAIWQYSISLIPDECLAAAGGGGQLDLDAIDEWWAGARHRPDVAERIERLLPLTCREEDSVYYGSGACHDACIALADGRVTEVGIRIDLRRPWRGILGACCELAREIDCSFVDADGRVLPPTMGIMEDEVRRSRAGQFVADPDGFLRSLAAKRRRMGEE